MFKEGDWIVTDTQCLGYVMCIHNNEQASVKLIQNRFGRSMNMASCKHFGQLKPAPMSTTDEDLYSMIEFSLEKDDKDWFIELTDRLGVNQG